MAAWPWETGCWRSVFDLGMEASLGSENRGETVISPQVNDTALENVTHDDAVGALKATQERVRLLVAKPAYALAEQLPPESLPQGELNPSSQFLLDSSESIVSRGNF